jgi:hypothetical protein
MQEGSFVPGNYRGIDIIPSEDIPNGYRRTTENAIYVSPGNYELLRPLSAKGTIIALGFLKEMGVEQPDRRN